MKGRQPSVLPQKREPKLARKAVFGMKRDSLKNVTSSSSKDDEQSDNAVTERGLLLKGVYRCMFESIGCLGRAKNCHIAVCLAYVMNANFIQNRINAV
jgi:hypothetical protein